MRALTLLLLHLTAFLTPCGFLLDKDFPGLINYHRSVVLSPEAPFDIFAYASGSLFQAFNTVTMFYAWPVCLMVPNVYKQAG